MSKKTKRGFIKRLDNLHKEMFAVADFTGLYPEISDKIYEMSMTIVEFIETVEEDIINDY